MTKTELRRQRNAYVARARHILDGCDNRQLTPAETSELEGIKVLVDDLDTRVTALEDAADEPVRSAGRASKPWLYSDCKPENRYSLDRAIQCIIKNGRLSGYEAEVSQEIQHRDNKQSSHPQSIFVPFKQENRALDTTTGSGGVATVTTADYIDLLRSYLVSDKLGVSMMTGLSGNIRIPRAATSGSSQWIAEGSGATASNETVDYVSLTPRTLATNVVYSRKFLQTSAFDVRKFVSDDISKSMAVALDTAFLFGSGGNAPMGVFNLCDAANVLSSHVVSYDNVVDMESRVQSANSLMQKPAYVFNPTLGRKLKTTPKLQVSGQSWYPSFIYNDENDNKLNGYDCQVTTLCSTVALSGTGNVEPILFGDWSEALIGLWGSGFELIVDEFSLADQGSVRLVGLLDVDCSVKHPKSFSVALMTAS